MALRDRWRNREKRKIICGETERRERE